MYQVIIKNNLKDKVPVCMCGSYEEAKDLLKRLYETELNALGYKINKSDSYIAGIGNYAKIVFCQSDMATIEYMIDCVKCTPKYTEEELDKIIILLLHEILQQKDNLVNFPEIYASVSLQHYPGYNVQVWGEEGVDDDDKFYCVGISKPDDAVYDFCETLTETDGTRDLASVICSVVTKFELMGVCNNV